ncbi:NAD(P)H-dependent flavin oxidoreductase [Coralliovum pocilloporae]|uniref:NAD(P)H-dependent flavin oxidoreductase n=1 Tax=Coralliovum pocilloporae TaxID=3066369 RepID=UPI003306D964
MIKTRLTSQFDLEHPIVCAPMALATGGALASAVTNAGGMGVLGGGYAGTLGGEPDLDEEKRKAGNARIGIGFITWALEKAPHWCDWALEQEPSCLFLSFGDPAPFARRALEWNIPVICQTQSLEHVARAVDSGAHVIVAQGTEAGGHGASRSTMPFVPEVADYLAKHAPDVLLLAAGGIADGRGLAASLMLGADGVLIGSRFWASAEALSPGEAIRRAIASSGDQTVRTTAVDALRGVPWPEPYSFRMLQNAFTDQWAHREDEAKTQIGAFKDTYDKAREEGDFDTVVSVVGEVTGLIEDRPPAADIVRRIAEEAEALLKNAPSLLA